MNPVIRHPEKPSKKFTLGLNWLPWDELGYFPIGILSQVWYLIVLIPDLCTLTYYYLSKGQISLNFNYKVNLKDFYTKLCVCSHK